MKRIKILVISILSIFLICISCNQDDDQGVPSISVNDFVWKGMNQWYYWQNNVTDLADNKFQNNQVYQTFLETYPSPTDLFNSLLYDYGTTDRFSWIVEDYEVLNNQFSGINVSFGMDYGLVYINQNTNELLGYVQYVVPNSPADLAGFKRGNIFIKINGTQLTSNNYLDLLKNNSAIFGLAKLENNQIIDLNQTITLTKEQVVENPIHQVKVITLGNHKIGYLMYNGFRANYNNELNNAIAYLQSNNITDLVIDLRYNGGGSVATAIYLGSMIDGRHNGSNFVSLKFNSKNQDQDQFYSFVNEGNLYNNDLENIGTFNINSLQLPRVYVLTLGGTASASELLINSLKPYIEVITIGQKTYGKNVGSITLYDSPSSNYTSKENVNTNHKWAMQPIVFKYFNAEGNSDFTQGITPDYLVNEIDYLQDLQPLGNENEALLNKAISLITGANKQNSIPNYKNHNNLFMDSKSLQQFGNEMYLDSDFYKNQ